MDAYIEIVKDRIALKEGKRAIETVLALLYQKHPMSTKELARQSFLPIPVVTAMKKEFIKLGVLEQKNGIEITELGRRYIEEALGFGGLDLDLYQNLIEDREWEERFVEELAGQMAAIYERRPQVDVTLDQAKGTPLTAIKRAVLCLKQQSLLGKSVLCVGDDDLVSVAIGFLLKRLYRDIERNRTKICVFEKDARYISYIQEIAKKHNLPIECVALDLREPLPLGYVGMFDCFFTDPPYTVEGMSLFLSRGIGGLKKERGLKVFLSFGQKPVEDVFRVQEAILAHGLILLEQFKAFNEYEGASLLGNISQMMVLESTDHVRAVIPATAVYQEKIYTAEYRDPDSTYCCRACKEILHTGKDKPYQTIEQLKERGCPVCGGVIFDKVRKTAEAAAPHLKKRKSLGEHILADFLGCSSTVLRDVEQIRTFMHEAAKRANASIVSEEFHQFRPWGVSGAIIVKESHLTIHTWPEYEYAAVDLFTCGDSLDIWSAMNYLKEKLECASMETADVARGVVRLGGVDSSMRNLPGEEEEEL